MSQNTYRRILPLVIALGGISLAIVLYGAPPLPVVPLLVWICVFWWESTRNADTEARPIEARIAAASARRERTF